MHKKKWISWLLAAMIFVTSIPVSAAENMDVKQIEMEEGASVQIALPELTEITYEYVSDNNEVATVNELGEITAIARGSCEITATAYYQETVVGTKVTEVTVTEEDGGETDGGETGGGETGGDENDGDEIVVPLGITTFVYENDKITVIEGSDTNYSIVNKAGDNVEAIGTDKDGNSYYVAAEDDVVAVEIAKKGGSYAFEGVAVDSSISVKKEAVNDAVLYLNGLDMTSSYTAPIVIKKDSTAKVSIIAAEGTINKLTDSTYNNDDVYADNGNAENAVIKAKAGSDVTIGGTGTLIVDGNGKNGIKAAAKLTIEDVNLSVTAENNAIASDTELMIKSGTIYAESGNDGIKSCNDDAPIGSIIIEGGNITVDSTGDCIVATNTIAINGGTFHLTAYDGYNAVYDGEDDSYPSAKGIKASGSYIVVDSEGNETEVDYVKENQLNISGGDFYINTADDAIHSDGDATITGGTFEIWTGDDGLHAEYWMTLGEEENPEAVPSIKVMSCYEAIEGASVIIYDGIYELYCSDDIINAANGDLNKWSYEITIYNGTFYGSTYAGDGYDSNSALNLLGGTHIIMSDTGLGENNQSLDGDGAVVLSGATLLMIGKSGMATRYSSQSTNAYVAFGSNSGMGGGFRPGQGGQTSQSSVSIKTGDIVAVKDASGDVVIEATVYWDAINDGRSASYVVCSAPALTSGSSYSLVVNGNQSTTANAQKTSSSGWYNATTIQSNTNNITSVNAVTDEKLTSATTMTAASADDGVLRVNVTHAEKPEVTFTYEYVSGDSKIATVSETGLVNGVQEGTTSVYVLLKANNVEVLSLEYEIVVNNTDNRDDTDDRDETDNKDDADNQKMPFEDVKVSDYFYDAVFWAVDKGVTNGFSETIFGTGYSCTREQVVTFLWNLAGKPQPEITSCTFKDIDVKGYYYQAMLWAVENKVVSGYNETFFGVGDPCTREQIVMILWKVAGSPIVTSNQCTFEDTDVDGYYYQAMLWAVENKVVSGYNETFFCVGDPCTREQIVTFLYRAFK